ncbi:MULTISPECIES: PTS sugar transporter subunit IIA [Sediminispirochaeta]|uniref:PTS IIA-like nitrogen-regulatory protein PtsN n=1 Tax=Sediminispirochaeta smaragdinae (strain DSM 11293 / JCM 15392 / SEBR 4228) TaxID=573413 RepID=E1R9A4_SEDSS|nr:MULTISPECIES: PTS sugar transporter subunit IIA [Sediminispirochaeta]ADK83073.1 putative PTS IIA-like nitrogen-regulatory protein PtsN [Sediminispirochaeta smaragdinae DSM 11293]
MKKLYEYLDEKNMLFTDSSVKDDILETMVDVCFSAGKVKDLEEFKTAIFEREAIMSTGIGLGIAVPHAKIGCVEDFFITVAILGEEVDWGAIDDKPVSIVFLIGGPENQQTEYLGILSKIVLFTKSETRRKALSSATTPEEVIKIFRPLN